MESGPPGDAQQPLKQTEAAPKIEATPAEDNSRNVKEEHKTNDSQKNKADGGAPTGSSDDKVKELLNKIAYYEREHEGFQNKILSQRQNYEQ